MRICPACAREYEDSLLSCPGDGAALVKLDTGAGERAEELVGQVVHGRYRVEQIIGRGGMGTVYACRHIVVGKQFAMKVLRPGVERSEEVLQRFIREAQAANAVRSRHICEMSDFGQLTGRGGAFYVIMELLDGISLTRALREGTIDTDALCHVFGQVGLALDKAHARGIIHRDLKPDNVMLVHEDDDPYFVKLVDFGIAKMMRSKAGDLTETGVILGTPYYMSPEQARGDQLDARSDIYALGVMMYRAFTGKLPFVADTAMGVLTRHLTEAPELPSRIADMAPTLERLILRCMEKKPIDRFQSMSDVVEAIEAVRHRRTRSLSSQDTRATRNEASPLSEGRRGPLRASPTRADTPGARSSSDLPPWPFVPPPKAPPGGIPAPKPPRRTEPVTSVRQMPMPVSDAGWGMQPAEAGYPPLPEADTNHPGVPAPRSGSPRYSSAATGPHALSPSIPPPVPIVASTSVSSDGPVTGPHQQRLAGPANPANWVPAPHFPLTPDIYRGEAPTDRGLVSTRFSSKAPSATAAHRTAWIGGLAAVLVLIVGLGAIAFIKPAEEPQTNTRPAAQAPPPQRPADPEMFDDVEGTDELEEHTDDSGNATDPASASSVAPRPQPGPKTTPTPEATTRRPTPEPATPEPATPEPMKRPDDGVRSPFD